MHGAVEVITPYRYASAYIPSQVLALFFPLVLSISGFGSYTCSLISAAQHCPSCQTSHRLYADECAWLCSNKTLFMDLEIGTSYHLHTPENIHLFIFPPTIGKGEIHSSIMNRNWHMGCGWLNPCSKQI